MHYVRYTCTKTLSKLWVQHKHGAAPIRIFRLSALAINALDVCNGRARPYCVCGSSLLSPAGESEVFLLLEEQGEADDGRVDQQTAKDGHGRRAACDFCRMP
jgi:hypothetical protein